MFILTTNKELWAHELMWRIMGCDHSLSLKEFLDQLNLIYIWICLYFVIDQEYWACKLMDYIMDCDHSLGQKEVLKFIYYFMIIFLIVYILLVPFSHQGSAIMFSFSI
jgi:ABC-type microcin C transport system permease subunit YejE